MQDWVKVYESGNHYQAEIIKSLLEAEEMEAVIINKQDSSYFFGEVEVYVQNNNVIKAKMIIDANESR